MEKDNWRTFKNYIKNYSTIFPFTWLGGKIVGMISLAITSLLIYMMGYLFLWGYYFGGNEDFSLLSMAVNYIPLNRTVAVLIGLFYFLTLIIMGLLLISIFNKGFSMTKIIFILITVATTNAAFILFFYGELNLQLFIKTLKFWSFPFIIVIFLVYNNILFKYPVASSKFFVYICFLMVNSILINGVILSNKLDSYLAPELYIALLYFGLPVIIIFKKVNNKFIKTVFKLLFYITGTIPLFPYLIRAFTESIIVNIVTSIFLVSTVVIISENNLHEKLFKFFSSKRNVKNKNQKQQRDDDGPPLFKTKPWVSSMYVTSVLLVLLVLAPNMLIKGGDYFHTIVNNNDYGKISYVWDGEIETVKGVLVSSKDNTFYISTKKQKLLVIKTKYILTDSR